MKYTPLLLLCIALAICLSAVRVRGERHLPQPVWISADAVETGEWRWQDAALGSVKGRLSFRARRPNQPIVVYLLRIDEKARPATQGVFDPPPRLRIGQRGARFEPGFAVMVRGQEVEFDNNEEDEISHNVYFLGALELDLGIFDRGESVVHKFDKYGEISVHCSIHKRMDARIFVAPNPAFALMEDEAENFEIKGVPEGRYRLLTWQRQKRFRDASIELEVKEGQASDVDVEMSR